MCDYFGNSLRSKSKFFDRTTIWSLLIVRQLWKGLYILEYIYIGQIEKDAHILCLLSTCKIRPNSPHNLVSWKSVWSCVACRKLEIAWLWDRVPLWERIFHFVSTRLVHREFLYCDRVFFNGVYILVEVSFYISTSGRCSIRIGNSVRPYICFQFTLLHLEK